MFRSLCRDPETRQDFSAVLGALNHYASAYPPFRAYVLGVSPANELDACALKVAERIPPYQAGTRWNLGVEYFRPAARELSPARQPSPAPGAGPNEGGRRNDPPREGCVYREGILWCPQR